MFALATLAVAALTAIQAKASPPAGCERNGTVISGDTCNSVSARYNVSTYQLALVNQGIINPQCSNLFPGEVLCLGITGQDCNTTYVVQTNDTCTSIATKFNIPVSTLEANNPNLGPQCLDIYPIQVLCVSNTIYHYNTTMSP